MADGYLIGAEYLFKSNAQRELGAIAKYSAQAAEGIEALQKSASGLSATLETMNRFVAGARSSLDSMLPMIDRLSVAFGRLDAAVESIGPTAASSGAEADAAFTGVVARLEAVTVARVRPLAACVWSVAQGPPARPGLPCRAALVRQSPAERQCA